jgi:predicted transcriptional regulator
MSKSVRLKDYLADELEKLAARENRSLQNLVNHLLEQAIEMERRRAYIRPAEDPHTLVAKALEGKD